MKVVRKPVRVTSESVTWEISQAVGDIVTNPWLYISVGLGVVLLLLWQRYPPPSPSAGQLRFKVEV